MNKRAEERKIKCAAWKGVTTNGNICKYRVYYDEDIDAYILYLSILSDELILDSQGMFLQRQFKDKYLMGSVMALKEATWRTVIAAIDTLKGIEEDRK